MNLENVIKEQAVQLKASRRNIDIAPDIPKETLEKWDKKYRSNIGSDIKSYILVMSYTKMGNFALTGDAMYYDNYLQGGIKKIKYEDIMSVCARKGGIFSTDKVSITLKTGNELCLDGCVDGIRVDKFAQIFSYIVKQANKNSFIISKQDVPLYEISEELKILYLKVLCNYAYIDNQVIDPNEYNAIGSFSIRMGVNSDSRSKLREYMNSISERIKTGYLLREIKREVGHESGVWDAIRYSLLQDVLYIHNVQNKNAPWTEDGFIGSLMEACFLKPDQINTMVRAVELNRKMQEKNVNLKELKRKWRLLLDEVRYKPGYVPTMYLFCSGSIYGIANYSSFFKKDDTSEKAINKQRELILHEIIENNQKQMNVLVDDMNYLAEKLEEAIYDGGDLREKYSVLLKRVKIAMNDVETSQATQKSEMDSIRQEQMVNQKEWADEKEGSKSKF